MSLLILHHDRCFEHHMGLGHPESPDRLTAIFQALPWLPNAANLLYEPATQAHIAWLYRVHNPHYVDHLLASVPASGYYDIDHDTRLNPHSGEAALYAAGAACNGIDHILSGHVKRAFCVTRPPGHHAGYQSAMGFCLFNNACIAAAHAQEQYGLQRIAIVDFDVHHGNGSEEIVRNHPQWAYLSIHQQGLYPQTGNEFHHPNIVNCPLPTHSQGMHIMEAWYHYLLPFLYQWQPELLILSAGFDGHRDDPLGGWQLEASDYGRLTQVICDQANILCQGRVLSILEGGYSLSGLAASTAAHVQALQPPLLL